VTNDPQVEGSACGSFYFQRFRRHTCARADERLISALPPASHFGSISLPRSYEPVFNVPPVVLWLSGAMAFIHGVRAFLDTATDNLILLLFAFIPARYDPDITAVVRFPGGIAADIWTFFTYAFLHAEVLHIAVNLVWLLAFGSAVAWRFGAKRFLGFFLVTSAASVAVYLLLHPDETSPVIGASGAISGTMAAACRFVFAEGGPIGIGRRSPEAYRLPALPLREALRNRQVIVFLGAWLIFNLMSAMSFVGSSLSGGVNVAWEAHIGGFFAGLLLFRFFDPVPRSIPTVPLAPTDERDET
jgi:membrane associated rhomboid family serine protease